MDAYSPIIGVVDDEPELVDLVGMVLQDEGYSVMCMEDPALTEQLHRSELQPQLFVLDVMLPGMTGIELARRLREDGFPDTPMIAISASTSMLQRARDSHLFQDALAKPFDLETFVSAVERQLHPQAA